MFSDPILGEIVVHKRRGARNIRIRIGTDGRFLVSAPLYTPLIFIKKTVADSRDELLAMREKTPAHQIYRDGDTISQHHILRTVPTSMVARATVKTERNTLLVYLPPGETIEHRSAQRLIRDEVIKILRREAKAYLPQRLRSFATEHGFSYDRVRFSHASGRWGSCSTSGTISLNIALMKLPLELIDYVLIHELCHTRQMNHSKAFWTEVERYDPHFRLHRRQIAKHSPTV